MSASNAAPRPVTLLIAALGGEGGGVLTHWIVNAAQAAGLPVQATSIPGVAQRTGATTYYVELWPQPWSELNGRAPLLALSPAMGEVDVLAVTELLEAGRAVRNGYVTRDRTLAIASTHRVYTTTEKLAMGDGRFDSAILRRALEQSAQACVLLDLDRLARLAQAPLNAVLLGVIAGCGRIPMPVDAFREGIRAEGKAAPANLRGFEAGLAAVKGELVAGSAGGETREVPLSDAERLRRRSEEFPPSVREVLVHALHRLTDYQDAAYAELYLERLEPFRASDEALLLAVAKHLAVRMSYEDAIRVAQAKIRPERLARIRAAIGAEPGDVVTVTEFLKPGLEEIYDILPRPLGAMLLALGRKWSWLGRWRQGMHVKTTSVGGYLQLRLLAAWRWGRRWTFRYQLEQQAIMEWLDTVRAAACFHTGLATEVAECARLIKGYGETRRRGLRNHEIIMARLVRPALNPGRDFSADAQRIGQARVAALADPDGTTLEQVFERLGSGQASMSKKMAFNTSNPG
jgi:indolepyruvate ferredoxin oxidoreductase beta subunit